MSKTENKAISSRFLIGLWDKGDLSVVDELIALDYVDHTPRVLPAEPELQGPDALKQLATDYLRRFSPMHVTIDDQIAEGNEVMYRVKWTVTLRLQGSHDQQVTGIGVGIDHVAADKIVENWNALDVLYRLHNMQLIVGRLGTTPITPYVPPLACPPSCPPNSFCMQGYCWHF